MNETKAINVRLPTSLVDHIDVAAEEAKQSRSDWVREALAAALAAPPVQVHPARRVSLQRKFQGQRPVEATGDSDDPVKVNVQSAGANVSGPGGFGLSITE